MNLLDLEMKHGHQLENNYKMYFLINLKRENKWKKIRINIYTKLKKLL